MAIPLLKQQTCRRPLLSGFFVLLGIYVSACAFQLRDPTLLPFRELYVDAKTTSGVLAELQRTLGRSHTATGLLPFSRSATVLTLKQEEADGILQILDEAWEDSVTGVTPSWRPASYRFSLFLKFRLLICNGQKELLGPTTLSVSRVLTSPDIDVVKRQSEEKALDREMTVDLTRQLLYRLAKAPVHSAACTSKSPS